MKQFSVYNLPFSVSFPFSVFSVSLIMVNRKRTVNIEPIMVNGAGGIR